MGLGFKSKRKFYLFHINLIHRARRLIFIVQRSLFFQKAEGHTEKDRERQTDTHIEIFCPLVHSQNVVRAGPGRSRECGSQSRSPAGVA